MEGGGGGGGPLWILVPFSEFTRVSLHFQVLKRGRVVQTRFNCVVPFSIFVLVPYHFWGSTKGIAKLCTLRPRGVWWQTSKECTPSLIIVLSIATPLLHQPATMIMLLGTLIFAVLGVAGFFGSKACGPMAGLGKFIAVTTAVCMWLAWIIVYMSQQYPLIVPIRKVADASRGGAEHH